MAAGDKHGLNTELALEPIDGAAAKPTGKAKFQIDTRQKDSERRATDERRTNMRLQEPRRTKPRRPVVWDPSSTK